MSFQPFEMTQAEAIFMINKRITELKEEVERLEGKFLYYSSKDVRFRIDHTKKTLSTNYDMLQWILTAGILQ